MKTILALAFLFVIVAMATADRKRCFCKVVSSSNNDIVIHNFGVIATHRNWLSVGCRRLHGCGDKCDRAVKEWVCKNRSRCLAKAGGNRVRAYYKASVCGEGPTNNIRTCGC